MGVTTNALNIIAANMTGSALLTHTVLGTSGLAFVSGQTALGSQTHLSLLDFSDTSAAEEVTFNTTFSPTEISGLVLREFGQRTTGSLLSNREVLNGSLVFNGEQELTIQQSFIFYI